MTITAKLNYVKVNHPEIYEELERELQAGQIDVSMVSKLSESIEPGCYRPLYLITSVLLLFSPATIKANSIIAVGVSDLLCKALGVGKSAISNRLPSARHYYNNVRWFRDNVDRIVKEVRG